jgi:hypothetical protein
MLNKAKSQEKPLKSVEFKETDEILFPDLCVICGKKTESRLERKIYGKFINNRSYKSNYHISLPICSNCKHKVNIKSGIDNIFAKLAILFSISGGMGGIIVGIYTYSIILAITIPILSFLISFFFYWKSIKKRIKLDTYCKIELMVGQEDTIKFSFRNIEYAKFIEDANFNN